MALEILFSAGTGKTLAATLQRASDGFYWNPVAAAWQNAPAYADKKVALAEGAAENAGGYTASVSGLGDAGAVRVRVHDEGQSNRTVGGGTVQVDAGGEVVPGLAVAERNAVADALLDRSNAIETGYTVRGAIRIIAAVVAGKLSGSQTASEVFKGLDGVTTRVTVTADSSGNRSAVAYS